jgi:hypothetical protein
MTPLQKLALVLGLVGTISGWTVGCWQLAAQRGAERYLLTELDGSVREFRQLIDDLRIRLAQIEAVSRAEHGER